MHEGDLRDERVYSEARADERRWERARAAGVSRRRFLATLAAGAVAAAQINADLTADEKEALQQRVELLHRNWTKDRDYLPPPTAGRLADLDPAVIVAPPKGLEIGYVPIVTRQAPQE